mmetsp:Transcript_626/g.816  ORF Transcript_626/g.816 Transcript_626/m.816 type:complete len:80 (+) Transcript_626:145-384(+)
MTRFETWQFHLTSRFYLGLDFIYICLDQKQNNLLRAVWKFLTRLKKMYIFAEEYYNITLWMRVGKGRGNLVNADHVTYE